MDSGSFQEVLQTLGLPPWAALRDIERPGWANQVPPALHLGSARVVAEFDGGTFEQSARPSLRFSGWLDMTGLGSL